MTFQVQEVSGGRHEDRVGASGRRTPATLRQVPEGGSAQQVQPVRAGVGRQRQQQDGRRVAARVGAVVEALGGGARAPESHERENREHEHVMKTFLKTPISKNR